MKEDLKRVLFEKTRKALDEYTAADLEYAHHCSDGGFAGLRSIRNDRHQRFCAIWSVIEAAELVDEYQAWKEAQRK